ncbi:protein serine/threonine kinase, putative [Entamoeba invadens IP1]|uniref:Protein serine/threonine kinase, putative n=1 Tax=Entamoeba invadens IP1 TaxID=370355 RepID=L7FLV5_ENTIV|nr:protein serine/threonine kinase, putative [Entamoeba invadens IP1]ELP87643.1 protein serine/threonine kinase, putative [Entamoeba invadens IP1]|eukprot:XP_004254414.1 protein serine/threonine kinase, putative [Entamoeba invadens IP1]
MLENSLFVVFLFFSCVLSLVWCDAGSAILYMKECSTTTDPGWFCAYGVTHQFYFTKDYYKSEYKIFVESIDDDVPTKEFFFNENGINLKSLSVCLAKPASKVIIYDGYRPEPFFISFNCSSRTSVTDGYQPQIEVRYHSLHLHSKIDQRFVILSYRNIGETVPNLSINGVVPQSVNFQFENALSLGTALSKTRFLFTGKSDESLITFNSTKTTGLIAKSVCTRNGLSRFLIFQTPEITNNVGTSMCKCVTSSEYITGSNTFNFPDCMYNGTLFDLDLTTLMPKSEESILIRIYVKEWYSMIFKLNQKYRVFGIDSNTLSMSLQLLDLQNTKVEFDIFVNVYGFRVMSSGEFYFKRGVQIVTSTLSQGYENNIVFTVENTFLYSGMLLKKCGKRVVYNNGPEYLCHCNFTNSQWEDYGNDTKYKNDCYDPSLKKGLILQIDSPTYSISSYEEWSKLKVLSSLTTLTGNATITINEITVFGNVIIENTIEIGSTITFKKGGSIIVKSGAILRLGKSTKFVFKNYSSNINMNGSIVVEKGGKVEFMDPLNTFMFDYLNDTKTPIELFSFEETQNATSFAKYNSLIDGKLYRVFQANNIDNTVVCNLTQMDYKSHKSYESNIIHCPINSVNAVISLKIDTFEQKEEFLGHFVQKNKILKFIKSANYNTKFDDENFPNVLLVDDNSIQIGDVKIVNQTNKVLVGNKFGFKSTSKSQNIKSENTEKTIVFDTTFSCVALLNTLQLTEKCLACKNDYYIENTTCNIISTQCILSSKNTQFSICEKCNLKYEAFKYECVVCSENCLHCVNKKCVMCESGFNLSNGICEPVDKFLNNVILYENQEVKKCSIGFYNSQEKCLSCDTNCVSCENKEKCNVCESTYLLNFNGKCVLQSGALLSTNYQILSCKKPLILRENVCEQCSTLYGNLCEYCDAKTCLKCSSNGVVNITDGHCVDVTRSSCTNTVNTFCTSCVNKNLIINTEGICVDYDEHCSVTTKDKKCLICNNKYHLNSSYYCEVVTTQNENCLVLNEVEDRCIHCEIGFYVSNFICEKCAENCENCFNNSKCLNCKENYFLKDDGSCVENSQITSNCYKMIKGTSQCALCDISYFRNTNGKCEMCIENCNECNQFNFCLQCEPNYFLLTNNTKCISNDLLTNCVVKSSIGCTICSSGFYLKNQLCESCSTFISNCELCENTGKCISCAQNFVLLNSNCVAKNLIQKCSKVKDSKCTKCAFWFIPSPSGTSCQSKAVWWVILLIVLVILLIIVILTITIGYMINKGLKRVHEESTRQKTCIFDIKRSNVRFVKTNSMDIVVSAEKITFEDEHENEINVDKECRSLFCVGNTSKNTIKVQFSLKESTFKYSIRTEPQIASIPKKKACEFEIFLTPKCSCKIVDEIMLIYSNLESGDHSQLPFQISAETKMSSKIDPDELVEEKKLGEGSFGIVYKGTFRGNVVAIKKMKQFCECEENYDEFENEIKMLEKFRSEYIVHFYGAVFIPSKICMVSEFAQYGSLQDLMKKKRNEEIEMKLRVKFMLDGAKGILYLHENGILHRDIKPDNILIFSLNVNELITAKLTDFGSARNINMLLTNMTFTKGIGTPIYMAPEVLKQEKYKKSADVYSFGISMFEVFGWCEAYPKTQFMFPWKIAEFVMAGNHLKRINEVPINLFEIVGKCWSYNQLERIGIEQVVKELQNSLL